MQTRDDKAQIALLCPFAHLHNMRLVQQKKNYSCKSRIEQRVPDELTLPLLSLALI